MSAKRNGLPGKVLWGSFLLAISLWMGAALVEYSLFNETNQGFGAALSAIDNPQILVLRLALAGAVIAGGYAVSSVLSRMALLEQVACKQVENLVITLDSVGDAVIVTDNVGKIVRMNSVAERLTGWAKGYADGRGLEEVFHIEDSVSRKVVPSLVDKVLKTGEALELTNDLVLVSRDGTEYRIADSAFPIRGDGKEITGVLLIFRDLTAKYKMAADLRRSESRFQGLVESSGDWIWEVDKEGVYTFASPKVEDILGYKAEEIIGETIYNLMPTEEAERIRILFKRLVGEHSSIVNRENICLHKSGREVVLETSGKPVFDERGSIVGYRGINHDITERKRNEETLTKRLEALTRPLEYAHSIEFTDLFDIEDIQRLQDEFAVATGVASLITTTDGTPITQPSNFCRLCMDIIRKSEKGAANCRKSDATIGRQCFSGPTIQPCLSGGLWDAGAAISVGGKHIANWLIGQVRDETQSEERMLEYARVIGADEDEFIEAFREVPMMSKERFFSVAQVLYTLANQLSTTAYQNVQQARFITERKATEKALKESESFLKGLFRVAPIGMGVVLGRVFKHVNKSMCEMTGYSADDLLEHNSRMLYESEEEFTRVGDEYRQGLALDKRSTESRWVRKDGTVIDVLLHSTPYDPEDPLKGAIFTASDITNRKKTERALRENERKWRGFFENAIFGIVILKLIRDEYGKVVDQLHLNVNPATKKHTGWEVDQLEGRRALEFASAEELSGILELSDRTAETGEPWRMEQYFPVYDRILDMVTFSLGEDMVATTFSDVTEKRRAEEELEKARNYIANIINSMPSVLVGVDAEGKITQWNKTAENTTGIEASEAYGKKLSDVFPRMHSEMDKIIESIKTRKIRQDQKKPYSTDDGTNYEDITIYPLITDGVEGAVVRIDDVTEHVRLEEMMIQSEKMLSVGGLAAGMAHEINNPLAGMMQTADVIANRLSNPELPANVQAANAVGINMDSLCAFMENRGILRMLDSIKESGKRAAKIVSNMLSFARKGDAQRTQISLEDMIDKTIELASADYDLKKQHDFKMIRIVRKYAENVPMVYCEAGKVQQVLFNILRNGAEAMRKAQVADPVFVVKTYFEHDRSMACLEIEDNGPGMTEEIRKRIFEPFFTTKPVGEGTGLGLSVSYFIITENHDGEMVVESQPGAGARFIIRLPLRRAMT